MQAKMQIVFMIILSPLVLNEIIQAQIVKITGVISIPVGAK
jgi:hypothetical protein